MLPQRVRLPSLVAFLIVMPTLAHAQADSVVLRITSPRGSEVQFSGVLTLKDTRTERRIEGRTPFEIKLPSQHVDARFTAADGGALNGDILAYRAGVQQGHVTGTVYAGDVKLYFEPGARFGFGSRVAQKLTP
jgi:hypothetical protein